MRVIDAIRRVGVPLPPRAVLRARIRSSLTGKPLPPGDFDSLFQREVEDRQFLLRRFEELGPIFIAYDWGKTFICIHGLDRCRRFLNEAVGKVKMETIDLRLAVPKGFMRSMEGDVHRKYRRDLVAALSASPALAPEIVDPIILPALAAISTASGSHANIHEQQEISLADISLGLLIQAFYGVGPEDERGRMLTDLFHEFGPGELVWKLGAPQVKACSRLVEVSRALIPSGMGGVVGAAHSGGFLDDTLLGNIIYMIEMGRHDVAGLLMWVLRYFALHPSYRDEIASEILDQKRPLATAFIRETLRLDQAERLMRRATEEFTFDGFLVPRLSMIRLCVWESHKDPEVFDAPFDFRAERFLEGRPEIQQYAPFGIDHHICPFDKFSVHAGALFLGVLARNYRVELIGDGPARRGRYTWHASDDFTVRLMTR